MHKIIQKDQRKKRKKITEHIKTKKVRIKNKASNKQKSLRQ